ncbi:MAG TPA: OmpA family protein [Xanthobacteraceae bacterium]|nr:OmpA family protein [Xanthobacteraceae bacterium]
MTKTPKVSKTHKVSMCRTALAAAVLPTLFAGLGPAAAADALTEEQIINALTPARTRSLTLTPAESAATGENHFLDTLRNRPAHSLTPGEREQIAAAAAAKPSIDIEINFDFRSAKISRSAASAVDTLGKALSNPDLKGSTFVLAGHTDGKGSLSYNQELSEKRVDTVKRYLVTHFKLSPANLVAVGYGKTKLKNANDPFGPENRRVQVVNMSESD